MNSPLELLTDEQLERIHLAIRLELTRRKRIKEIEEIEISVMKYGIAIEYTCDSGNIFNLVEKIIYLPVLLYCEPIVEGDPDCIGEAFDYDTSDVLIKRFKDHLPEFRPNVETQRTEKWVEQNIEDWFSEPIRGTPYNSKGIQSFTIWFRPFTTELSGFGFDLEFVLTVYFLRSGTQWIYYYETDKFNEHGLSFRGYRYKQAKILSMKEHSNALKNIVPIR